MEYRLLNCKTVSEFLAMYFGLSMKDRLSVFNEEVHIPQGTNFYRIRSASGVKDPDDPKEWGPVPQKIARQGRFNASKESVLYVASDPDCLEREVRLKDGDEYYLAKYICLKDFSVGTFLGTNSWVNMLLHRIAMSVSGPEELTEKELLQINKYLEKSNTKNLEQMAMDMLSSLYLYRYLPKNFYDVTNKIGKIVLKKNDNGIRYSSVYIPIEWSGAPVMITLDGVKFGNYALTSKGCANIEFVSSEKRICSQKPGLEDWIEMFAKSELEKQ